MHSKVAGVNGMRKAIRSSRNKFRQICVHQIDGGLSIGKPPITFLPTVMALCGVIPSEFERKDKIITTLVVNLLL